MPQTASSELELSLLQLLIRLHSFGEEGQRQSSQLRSRIRTILLAAPSSEDACIDLEKLQRRFIRKAEALDGSLDAKKERKRQRREALRGRQGKLVLLEAGEGDDDEEEENMHRDDSD